MVRMDRTQRSYVSAFKSSSPQRPTPKTAMQSYGGRPLGPTTYIPKNNLVKWENDVTRMSSSFASKTTFDKVDRPLTCDIDFMDDPYGAMHASYASSPSSRGHGWPNALEPREPARDPGLDEFSLSQEGTLALAMSRSSRRYASSFVSAAKRMPPIPPAGHATSEVLGPGAVSLHGELTWQRWPRALRSGILHCRAWSL